MKIKQNLAGRKQTKYGLNQKLTFNTNKLSLRNADLFNPLTPGTFRQQHIFRTFWRFSAWKWAKLAPIYSTTRYLQHGSMPFFPPAPCCTTFLRRNQTFEFLDEKVTYFLSFCFFLCNLRLSYLLAAVIVLLLGLFLGQTNLRKHYREGQILPWSSHV